MNCSFFRTLAATVLFSAATIPTFGQDLLAKQAPIDRKVKAVDSVMLQRLTETKVIFSDATSLYKSWNTENVHCYSESEIPDSFVIDLRGFAMPTPSRNVTSNYGYRRTFRRMHRGIDVKVYTGDTIYAAFDGKVRLVKYERKGYGKYIVMRHENGLETIYGHLSKQLVKENDIIKAGEPIGLGGNTGRSFGSHLHFETRLVGHPINPAFLFDFVNQDVTGDYYTFVKNKKGNSTRSTATKTEMAGKSNGARYYRVRNGDNLWVIAKRLGTNVNTLCKINKFSTKKTLRPGQILKY